MFYHTIWYIFVIVALVAERLGTFGALARLGKRLLVERFGKERWAAIALGALPMLFLAELVVFDRGAARDVARGAISMPITVRDDRVFSLFQGRTGEAIVIGVIAIFQMLCLGRLGADVAWTSSIPLRRLLLGVAAIMSVIAIFPHAMTSGDSYSYVAYSMLGHDAYNPPSTRFPGELGAINDWWGVPVVPSPYGPLWLAFSAMLGDVASTIVGKILVFHLAGLLLVIVTGALLTFKTADTRVGALWFCNPVVYLQFVVNGHNYMAAIALTAGAFLLAPKRPWVATCCATAAGLIKLTFVPIALLALVPIRRPRDRLALAALSVTSSVAISLVWGGPSYVRALQTHIGSHHGDGFGDIFQSANLVLALTATILALSHRRAPRSMVLAFPALGIIAYPWYSAWSLPFAWLEPRLFLVFLAIWPGIAFLIETVFDVLPFDLLAVVALVAIAIALWARALLARAAASAPADVV